MANYQGSITVKRRPKDGKDGANAHSPYIGADGYWYYWDDALGAYVKSDDKAAGEQGIQGPVPVQKEWVPGDLHRNNDTIKDYIYVRGSSGTTSYAYELASKGDVTAGAAPVGGAVPAGYKAVSWLPSLMAKVLIGEEANLANFIFKQGKLLATESTSGEETAGISGIQGTLKNNPAFWAGGTYAQAFDLIEFLSKMSAGTTPTSGEYDNLAKITLLHNGASKIGDFIIESNGRITMVNPTTGYTRLAFNVMNIPNVSDLLSSTQFGQTVTNAASMSGVSGSTTLPNGLSITKENSLLTFSGTLRIQATLNTPGGFTDGSAEIDIQLFKNGVYYTTIVSGGGPVNTNNTSINITQPINSSRSVPAGNYTIVINRSYFGVTSQNGGISDTSTFAWNFNQNINRFEFGLNGFMGWYTNEHMHFTEGGGLDGQAPYNKWNAPGVLLSATVAAGGGWNSVWGAKGSGSAPVNNSTGRYTVYHTVGHANYQVFATAITSSKTCHIVSKGTTNFVIEWRTVASTPALVNTGFDFQIVGNNYST